MERAEDKGKGEESFLIDQLSHKKNIDDADVDLELHLRPLLKGNFGIEYLKESKIVNLSNFGDKTNKSGDEFQFSLIRTSFLSMEAEEEWGEEEESQSPTHLETMLKRWEKLKNIIEVNKKNKENDGSSGVPMFVSQPLIKGPSELSRLESDQSLKLVQKLVAAALEITKENSPILSAYIAQAKWLLKYFTIKMPRVSIRGDGPNGNKTDGLLFAYMKGEDMQIICNCHGDFLSPAEFVEHAGVGDVENPLKHIITNSLPM